MKNLLDNNTELDLKKPIKTKLLVDIVAQTILLTLTAIIATTVWAMQWNDYSWAAGIFYFGLGGYQLITSLVHLAYRSPSTLFKLYYIQLVVYVFLFMALFGAGSLMCGYILLFVTPLSAIYYLTITIVSYNHAKK